MDRDERVREIKAALVRAGVRQKDVAARLKVSACHVNNVISGASKSRRVVAALVESGVPEELMGEADRAA